MPQGELTRRRRLGAMALLFEQPTRRAQLLTKSLFRPFQVLVDLCLWKLGVFGAKSHAPSPTGKPASSLKQMKHNYAQAYALRCARKEKSTEARLSSEISSLVPLYCTMAISHLMVSTHRIEPGLPFCEANMTAIRQLGVPAENRGYYRSFLSGVEYSRLMSAVKSAKPGKPYALCYRINVKETDGSTRLSRVSATLCCIGEAAMILAHSIDQL